MGSSSWSRDANEHLSSSYTKKSVDDVFVNNKTKKASDDMSPKGLTFREARDSAAHPESLALIINLDVTGSMGSIPEAIARHKMGALMDTLIKHGIEHASVLFNCIGDHISDDYPLQVGQFESGAAELHKWLTQGYLEGNGGGQNKESYLLAWLIAARHTSIDCFEKRGQKGILFTIGDERSWESVSAAKLRELMGYTEAEDIADKQILAEAQRLYHVFHIHINSTQYRDDVTVLNYWKGLVGERLIILDDYNNIAEVIASTVALIHGIDLEEITKHFDAKTASSVKNALMKVDTGVSKSTGGVVNL